jgi:hypothetical protein
MQGFPGNFAEDFTVLKDYSASLHRLEDATII